MALTAEQIIAGSGGVRSSVAIDNLGRIGVAYTNAAGHVYYTLRDDVDWSTPELVADGNSHRYVVIKFNSNNIPHIMYANNVYTRISKKDGTWSINNTIPAGETNWGDLTIDDNDNLHILTHFDDED